MKVKNLKLLLFSLGISQLAGIIGSLATSPAIPSWYAGLVKPSFNPPNWLFAPVWITLYTFMGIALYLVWVKDKRVSRPSFPVKVFLIHLVINSLWSIVFFGLKELFFALIMIIVLWLMIVYLIKLFGSIDKRAAYLLVPYLFWVSFASILNYSIWRLN